MGFLLSDARKNGTFYKLFVNSVHFISLTIYFVSFGTNATPVDLRMNVTVSPHKRALNEAGDECEVAGADQNGFFDAKSLHLSVLSSNTSIQEVWIASSVKYTKWLNLKSCQYGKPFGTGLNISSSINPVEDCFKECDSDSRGFVLTGDMCYCRINVSLYDAGCLATPCDTNSKDFCGKQVPGLSFRCMCQYKYTKYSDKGRIGNCMTENYVGPTLERINEDCSNKYPYVCREGHSNTPIAYLDYKNWTEAGFKCYRDLNKQYATTSSPTIQTKVWTSVFRKQNLILGIPTNETQHCVSLLINGSSILSVNIRKCNISLPVLCKAVLSDVGTSVGDENFVNDNFIYVIVVIVCIIIFIIVAITVYFVCRKKQKHHRNPPSAQDISPPITSSPRKPNVANNVHASPNGIENVVAEQGADIHTYSNIQKGETSTTQNSTSTENTNTYGVLQKGSHQNRNDYQTQYDTMANIKNSLDTGNDYGHLALGFGQGKKISALSDYDSMTCIDSDKSGYLHLNTGHQHNINGRDSGEYDSNSMII